MPSEGIPVERCLYSWEIQEARRVFANGLAYSQVRICECADWPNTMKRIGSWVQRTPYTGVPNAVTLGNKCYFPVRLLDTPVPINHPEHYKIGWLIHELTHAWQYQRMGWGYLIKALQAQLGQGSKAYDFGGETGLLDALQRGRSLAGFNLEQQGDICRSYYERLCSNGDASAWQPYIAEIQQTGNP
jgi:hypothetical protein